MTAGQILTAEGAETDACVGKDLTYVDSSGFPPAPPRPSLEKPMPGSRETALRRAFVDQFERNGPCRKWRALLTSLGFPRGGKGKASFSITVLSHMRYGGSTSSTLPVRPRRLSKQGSGRPQDVPAQYFSSSSVRQMLVACIIPSPLPSVPARAFFALPCPLGRVLESCPISGQRSSSSRR